MPVATVTPLPDTGVPPDTEFVALTSFLTLKGLTAAQATAVLGAAVSGRTRAQIAQALATWLKTLPKGP